MCVGVGGGGGGPQISQGCGSEGGGQEGLGLLRQVVMSKA